MADEIEISTMAELSQWIGANGDDEASMSHRIYKDTRCGAWLSFYKGERTILQRPATWDVEMIDSDRGIVCTRGRAVKSDDYVSPQDFPVELKQFLTLSEGEDGIHYVCVDDPDMVCISEIPETDRVHRLGDTSTWRIEFPTWQVTEPSDEVIGVQLGSIVEGSDVDTSIHTLVFPFTLAAFQTVIECVENEAEEIWSAANA